jgi:hypothetical protein
LLSNCRRAAHEDGLWTRPLLRELAPGRLSRELQGTIDWSCTT